MPRILWSSCRWPLIGASLAVLLWPSNALQTSRAEPSPSVAMLAERDRDSEMGPLVYKSAASSSCSKCAQKWQSGNGRLLFVGVFTAPQYRHRRNEVRNSWMKDEMIKADLSPVRAKFILGSLKNNPHRKELEAEQRKFRDMIFLDVREGYDNLPNKTLAFFRWFNKTQDPTFFAMKLDDDTFPNFNLIVPDLVEAKDAEKHSLYTYFGALLWNSPVLRDGKWAETNTEFKAKSYPVYAAGSGYVLSMPLVKKLEEVRIERPEDVALLRNEDTTIGNFVHQENWASIRVDYVDVNNNESVSGCADESYFAMNLWPGELRCMWEKRLNGTTRGKYHEKDMCCRPLEDYGLWEEGMEKPDPA